MRLFLIKCLSLLFCAFAFTCGPLGTAGRLPRDCGSQRLCRLPGLTCALAPRHSEGPVGLEILPQLGVPGVQAWPRQAGEEGWVQL